MGANAQMRVGQAASGVLGLVGAAPQTGGDVTSNKILMGVVERSTLSALVYAKATTSSLTITASWQVSQDGTNWYDAVAANNPANVVLVTASANDTVQIAAPDCVYGALYARLVVVTAGATAGDSPDDEFSVSYSYRAVTTAPIRIPALLSSTGVAGLSGAAPQTGAGNSIVSCNVEPGTLGAHVYAKATTNLLTITGKWQTSANGSTWRDCDVANNAANVALVTGTGSAVTTTKRISAPASALGQRYCRFVVVTGAASGGGAGTDEYSIAYSYVPARTWD